jgi:hypothetical protein
MSHLLADSSPFPLTTVIQPGILCVVYDAASLSFVAASFCHLHSRLFAVSKIRANSWNACLSTFTCGNLAALKNYTRIPTFFPNVFNFFHLFSTWNFWSEFQPIQFARQSKTAFTRAVGGLKIYRQRAAIG